MAGITDLWEKAIQEVYEICPYKPTPLKITNIRQAITPLIGVKSKCLKKKINKKEKVTHGHLEYDEFDRFEYLVTDAGVLASKISEWTLHINYTLDHYL